MKPSSLQIPTNNEEWEMVSATGGQSGGIAPTNCTKETCHLYIAPKSCISKNTMKTGSYPKSLLRETFNME